MRKVNMVTLEEEYWYALSDCYASYGFKSRQEFIESLLTSWVDSNAPESLKKGLEKMRFFEASRITKSPVVKRIPPIVVKTNTSMFDRDDNQMEFTFQDGRVEVIGAGTPLEGFRLIEGDGSLTEKDMADMVVGFKYLEKKKR